MSKAKLKTFHYPVAPSIREDDGPYYEVHDDVVTWRGDELDADPKTFVPLSDSWGLDKHAVFVQDTRKSRIDRASFRLLNPLFAVDKHAVYDWEGVVKNADPQSFAALDSGAVIDEDDLLPGTEYLGYARDKNGIWFHEQMLGRAALIKSADAASFRSFGNGFGADAASVYRGKSKLAKSDPASWMYLGRGFSMDHARVWFLNREIKPVRRDNFFVLNLPGGGLATDGSRYFQRDSEIESKKFAEQVEKEIKSCNRQAKAVMKGGI